MSAIQPIVCGIRPPSPEVIRKNPALRERAGKVQEVTRFLRQPFALSLLTALLEALSHAEQHMWGTRSEGFIERVGVDLAISLVLTEQFTQGKLTPFVTCPHDLRRALFVLQLKGYAATHPEDSSLLRITQRGKLALMCIQEKKYRPTTLFPADRYRLERLATASATGKWTRFTDPQVVATA